MPRNVVFVAPFPTDITMRFVRAAARLPDVRLLGVVHTPPNEAVYHDFVKVTDPLREILAYDGVADDAATGSTERERRADDEGKPHLGGGRPCVLHRASDRAPRYP